jgi:hypothetical protein
VRPPRPPTRGTTAAAAPRKKPALPAAPPARAKRPAAAVGRSEQLLRERITRGLRSPRIRTLSEFAEQEIKAPDGPYAGRRIRLDRSPAMRLLFAELDRHWWRRTFITGPNQDGKTLALMVILMYLLFERQETVIWGVTDLDMAADKWKVDLLPVIKASRYAELLPSKGAGSREGNSVLIQFGNGAFLRFMMGGGDDQARAGFTSQNLVVTETDGFDEVGSSSREGDKFSQLERRTLAYGEYARVIAECTVSIEQGRTWQEYQRGTRSRHRAAVPALRRVGDARARAPGRLAGRQERAGGDREFPAVLPQVRRAVVQRPAPRGQHPRRPRAPRADDRPDGAVEGPPDPPTNTSASAGRRPTA